MRRPVSQDLPVPFLFKFLREKNLDKTKSRHGEYTRSSAFLTKSQLSFVFYGANVSLGKGNNHRASLQTELENEENNNNIFVFHKEEKSSSLKAMGVLLMVFKNYFVFLVYDLLLA